MYVLTKPNFTPNWIKKQTTTPKYVVVKTKYTYNNKPQQWWTWLKAYRDRMKYVVKTTFITYNRIKLSPVEVTVGEPYGHGGMSLLDQASPGTFL
jgi:hypothetical protein